MSKIGLSIMAAGLALGSLAQTASAQVRVSAQVSVGAANPFARQLAAHGRWVTLPTYGQVFLPNDRSYEPYAQGHWVDGRYGLTWVSDVPYGKVVEHYGRWIQTDGTWAWIPGQEYSPGWVEWRDGGDTVGWAPLGPDGHGVSTAHFVPVNALEDRDLRRHYVNDPGRYDVMGYRPDLRWARARAMERRERAAENAERSAEDAERAREQAYGGHNPYAAQQRREAQAQRRAQQAQRRFEQMMRRGGPGADPAADRRDAARARRDADADRRDYEASRRDGLRYR